MEHTASTEPQAAIQPQRSESKLNGALALREMGLHPFPLGSPHDELTEKLIQRFGSEEEARKQWPKTPRIPWAEYQTRQPTEDEVRNWFTKWPNANIAIVTGIQFDVVDADSEKAVEWCRNNLTRTPWENHTGRGVQFLYRKTELDVRNSANPNTKVDTRGVGGYIVAPGSTHSNGTVYQLVVDEAYGAETPDDLPALTEQDLQALGGYTENGITSKHEFNLDLSGVSVGFDDSGVEQGGRNNRAAQLAGRYITAGDDAQTVLHRLRDWNTKNNPPLPDDELQRTLASVIKTHQRNNPDAVVPGTAEKAQEPAAGSWPTLVPLDEPDLPSIDASVLPTCLDQFVTGLAAATETPLELAVGMALAACSTAASRSVEAEVEPGYGESINLWILVALQPGNRKSAVQGTACAPLECWECEQRELIEPEIRRIDSERKTAEARAQAMRKNVVREDNPGTVAKLTREIAEIEANLPEAPLSPRLWSSDATPEKLGSLLADHGECVAWLSSEGGLFDMFGGLYSGGIPNLDLLLKSHSGDSERVDRGSRPPVHLQRPRLTIGISPQPEVLRGLAKKRGFRGRGLLARFLYLIPKSPLGYRKWNAAPIPPAVSAAYQRTIRAMLDWEPLTDEKGRTQLHTVRLSPESHAEFKDFALAIEKRMLPGEDFEHITDWAGKAPGAAARLAGVLHCVEHASVGSSPWEYEIQASTMVAALELMAVFAQHSLAAFGLIGADPSLTSARHVWDWIRRNRLSVFTISEAFNALKGRFTRVEKVKTALSVLEERGYVEVQDLKRSGQPGRPRSPAVLVRPEIVESWK